MMLFPIWIENPAGRPDRASVSSRSSIATCGSGARIYRVKKALSNIRRAFNDLGSGSLIMANCSAGKCVRCFA